MTGKSLVIVTRSTCLFEKQDLGKLVNIQLAVVLCWNEHSKPTYMCFSTTAELWRNDNEPPVNVESLAGYLPIPPNFTTVGKPQITVNQYDSPLDVYSDDTLEEMKEERLVMQNPDLADRITASQVDSAKHQPPKSDNPLAAQQGRKFDPTKSAVLQALWINILHQTFRNTHATSLEAHLISCDFFNIQLATVPCWNENSQPTCMCFFNYHRAVKEW